MTLLYSRLLIQDIDMNILQIHALCLHKFSVTIMQIAVAGVDKSIECLNTFDMNMSAKDQIKLDYFIYLVSVTILFDVLLINTYQQDTSCCGLQMTRSRPRPGYYHHYYYRAGIKRTTGMLDSVVLAQNITSVTTHTQIRMSNKV